MAKGFVKLRRGIVDHFPDLSDGELRLFFGLLVRAKGVGPLAGTVHGSMSELMDRFGFKRRESFINARKRLEKRGWIVAYLSTNRHEPSYYKLAKFRGPTGPKTEPVKAVENSLPLVDNPVENSGTFPQERTGTATGKRTGSGPVPRPVTPPILLKPIDLLLAKTLETLEKEKTLKNPLDDQPLEQIRIIQLIVSEMEENNPGRPGLVAKLGRYAREHEHADVRASAIEALTALGVQAA